MFLVDGKLVVLQPSTAESGELKYDMRVIIQNVEYYALMQDLPTMLAPSHYSGIDENGIPYQTLNDSLWVFDGQDIKVRHTDQFPSLERGAFILTEILRLGWMFKIF